MEMRVDEKGSVRHSVVGAPRASRYPASVA